MAYFTDNFDDKIVSLLKNGAVGFMPSDTVYGLSASALNKHAVEKIYQLKQRDDNKPCVILLAGLNQALELRIKLKEFDQIKKYWPAPLTFIASANRSPEYLHRGLYSLAVRVPDGSALRDLLSKTGPLVSTSANIQDEPVAHTPQHAKEIFGDKLDFYVDIGVLSGQPSTIVQVKNGQLKIVRPGAYKL